MTETLERTAKSPGGHAGLLGHQDRATTLGETAGDAVSMSMNLGYLVAHRRSSRRSSSGPSVPRSAAKRFHPFLYWATIIATTTVGTTLADFADRSLGIGYAGGSLAAAHVALGVTARLVSHAGLGVGGTVSSPRPKCSTG